MKFVASGILLLIAFFGFSQDNFSSIDTLSSTCKVALNDEYTKKFEGINKSIFIENTNQRKLTKEIYNEIQEGFFHKIKSNNFICNNDLNLYLQGLMNEVLTRNSINTDGYKILLSKDSQINAYNTGDGTVVINYGLFLSVENEDELVFVISHEIGHQYLKHIKTQIEDFTKLSTSEEIITKTKEIRRQKYGKASKATDLMKNISYQNYHKRRKKEVEADSIGLVFYKKTFRNPKAVVTILSKLDDADVEMDSISILEYKNIFEKNNLILKQKYFEQEKSLFVKYDYNKEVKVDSLKSHPDCATRIKLIEQYSEKMNNNKFNSPKSFVEIKKNSVHQNLYNLYSSDSYGHSLYEALKIYKKNDQDAVLKNIIYLNLVKIYNSKLDYTINRYVMARDNLNNSASLNRFITLMNSIKLADFEKMINNFKS
jgi:hypothetical protein